MLAWADPAPAPCEGDRYIGYASTPEACTNLSIQGWDSAPLFTGEVPLELGRYCLFTRDDTQPPAPFPTFNWGPDSPTVDCAVVTAHATELSVENQAALEAAFRAEADAVNPLPAPSANIGNQPPTKVIVVDASKTNGFPLPSEGMIEHGKLMGMIVRQLACPAGSPVCAAEVANSLALPLVRTSSGLERRPNGGRFGSFGDLAQAIRQGVTLAGTQGGRTIFNLSVGWDGARYGGVFAGTNWQTLSPPIRAIYSALSYASCRGVLTIAASGNSTDGPDPSTGPSHPGAWEAKAAPTAARCSSLMGTNVPPPATTYRRLVYAVGGVDGRDLDLANRRPTSRPPLVAPGDHATVSNGQGEITDVFTGSSISAAVASAAAAIAWRYDPLANPHDIMRRVRQQGTQLPGRTVEFAREACVAPDCNPNVYRVSICGILESAFLNGASADPNCTQSLAFRDARPDITTQSIQPLVCTQPAMAATPAIAPCVGQYYSESGTPPQECPANQLANHHARPFSTPQPDKIACPTCPMEVFTAMLNLNRDYSGLLSKPTIVIKPFNQDKKIIDLVVDEEALYYADPIKVENLPFNSSETEWATVDFEVNAASGAYSSSSPLIIVKDP